MSDNDFRPAPVLTGEEAAEWDRDSIDWGVHSELLMGWAGFAVYREMAMQPWFQSAGSIDILAGPGNNGGDGFVIAWHIATATGKKIRIYRTGLSRGKDAQYFSGLLEKYAGAGKPAQAQVEIHEASDYLTNAKANQSGRKNGTVIIEALFGTGLNKPPHEDIARLIQCANQMKGVVRVAVDIAGGVYASGQKFEHEAFRADHTYTFGAAKIGHLLEPGILFRGELHVLPIGFLPSRLPPRRMLQKAVLEPVRKKDSHKYSSGVVTVLGGDPGMEGAAIMAARSFLALGGGLARIVTSSSGMIRALGETPELMIQQCDEPGEKALELLEGLAKSKRKQTAIIGVGLSVSLAPETWKRIVSIENLHLVVDGSGLNRLAQHKEIISNHSLASLTLTPHLGEAERLQEKKVEHCRFAALEISSRYNANVYLKGPGGIVVIRDQKKKELNLEIYPGSLHYQLATGGTGDVLSGVLANMIYRFGPAGIEAGLFVYFEAAKGKGGLMEKDFVTPSEIIDNLRDAVNDLGRAT